MSKGAKGLLVCTFLLAAWVAWYTRDVPAAVEEIRRRDTIKRKDPTVMIQWPSAPFAMEMDIPLNEGESPEDYARRCGEYVDAMKVEFPESN